MPVKGCLGLWINDEAVTGVYAEKQGKQASTIKEAFHLPVPAGLIIDGQVLNFPELAGRLKTVIKERSLKGKKVNLAIATSHAVNRLVNLPDIAPKEMKEAVYWEIKPFLPPGQEDVSLDYVIVQKLNREIVINQVYVAVLTRKLVEDNIRLLKEISLIPWRIESNWIVFFRLWQLLTNKFAGEQAPDNWLQLYVENSGKGYFLANDLTQGFTIRQILARGEDKTLAEEINYVVKYFQEKYANHFSCIVMTGKPDSRYEEAIAAVGKKVVFVDLLELAAWTGIKRPFGEQLPGKFYISNYILAFGLSLGEIFDG